jgi:hypothetical protein
MAGGRQEETAVQFFYQESGRRAFEWRLVWRLSIKLDNARVVCWLGTGVLDTRDEPGTCPKSIPATMVLRQNWVYRDSVHNSFKIV